MARQKRDTKAMLKVIERSSDRSDLFWWMVEQHDEIIKKANGNRIKWPSLCAEAARAGRMDRLGQPPSVMTAKKTWQRAQKEVAAGRAAEAAGPQPRVNSSRMDKNWRPANAPSPPDQAVTAAPPANNWVAPQNQFQPIRKKLPHEKKPYDPEAALARLDRVINERSGR